MTPSIEAIRARLQAAEDKYLQQAGLIDRGFKTPPITKFTLTDPDMYVPDPEWVQKIVDNAYVDGTSIVVDDDWDVYQIFPTSIPLWIREEARSVRYQGYLFGDASIVFLDTEGVILGSYKAPDGEIITDTYLTVPRATSRIEVSRYRNPPVPVKVNFQITYQTFTEMNVTKYVSSWTDLEDRLERDMTSGVFESESLPVILTELAKDFIDEVFALEALHSRISFNVYLRDDIKLNVYTLLKSSPMDFQTYKSNKDQVSITLIEADLTEQLNSRGKNKYDIPVSELTSPKKWNYERMTMLNRGNYSLPVDQKPYDHFANTSTTMQPYVYLNTAEMTPGSAEHDIVTQQSRDEADLENYFFKVASMLSPTDSRRFTLDLKFTLHCREPRPIVGNWSDGFNVYILKNLDFENPLFFEEFTQTTATENERNYDVVVERIWRELLDANDKLSLVVQRVGSDFFNAGVEVYCTDFTTFQLSYTSTGPTINDIDVISPIVLCQNLLDRVSGQPGRFTTEFNWGDIDYIPMLCAAETIRNFPKANLHASLNDVIDWMAVLGYEYSADGRVLTFKMRDEYFKPDVTALTLKGSENADLVVEGSEKFAFTSIQIGYEPQDYESVNGRFEANGTFEYSTDYTNVVTLVKKMISPYRADPIGIELLCWERKNDTKDTKSDNDIFVIAMKEEEDHFAVYDAILAIPEDAPSVKMFNAVFNPYFLVKQNESLIGINSRMVKFTSTTSNRETKITDVADIYVDQAITKQLFKPYTYNFVTGNHIPLPSKAVRNGLVKFWYNKKLKSGYIQRILKNYSKELDNTWVLYAID